ncbi:MAG: hypothetical protein QOF21_3251 [Actinomycetota bacterium]
MNSLAVAELLGFNVDPSTLTLGFITGLSYGLLAVGLVIVYRSNKIINFAHGEIGGFGAAFLGVAVLRWGVPYWVGLPMAMVLSAGMGGLAEVAIIRRLRTAPKIMSLVATLGFAQVLFFTSGAINALAPNGAAFPEPSFLPTFRVGPVLVTRAYFGMLILSPLAVAAIVGFLRYSRFGLAVRAAAANPEAARMAGVFSARMSTLAWAIAGAVAALTAVLLRPALGFIAAAGLGPAILVRALAAAVIGRMQSLPMALAAGVGVGVLEQILKQTYPDSGTVELALFVVILGALLFQTRAGTRERDSGEWSAVQPWPPLSRALRNSRTVRFLGSGVGIAALAVAVVIPVLVSNQTSTTLTVILAIALIGLSLGIVTGLGGQLSLGQFALAGVGAAVSIHIADATGNFPLAFLGAGLATAAASVVIGLPALRIKGLLLAVTTLGFAVAAERWLLQQPWMLGSTKIPGRPIFNDYALDRGKSYYLFAVVVFTLCLVLSRNVWRSGLGRRQRALRDNEDGARAFSVPATRVKLETFAIAGFFAGVGGALYGHTLSALRPGDFAIGSNIEVVALVVIGGIGLLAGPLLGALYIIGIPRFFTDIGSSGLAATSAGWLLLILYFPSGLAHFVRPIRERAIALALRFDGRRVTPEEIEGDGEADQTAPSFTTSLREERPAGKGVAGNGSTADVLVEVRGLRKSFGGVHAVDGVDLDVRRGETLGLIGPNGAGKTTLFELLGGFSTPDEGVVTFDGHDVTRYTPERRAQLGVIRSFQDAALFPTLTVVETIQLALERRHPTATVPSLLGFTGADKSKYTRALELVDLMGLGDYADKQTGELSTGTRRITELTCVIALEPTLLLLDEPSSGVAQRETEALGALLARVKSHLGATLIVIEHDMPLITAISDRIIAMESGAVIATGTPKQVMADPLVLESYLGGDLQAVARSGRVVVKRRPSRARAAKQKAVAK